MKQIYTHWLIAMLLMVTLLLAACGGATQTPPAGNTHDATTAVSHQEGNNGSEEMDTTTDATSVVEMEMTDILTKTDMLDDTDALTETDMLDDTDALTETDMLDDTDALTETDMLDDTDALTETDMLDETDALTETDTLTETDVLSDTTTATEGAEATEAGAPITFGMVLVGPYNDAGWSQAHYDGAKYAESLVPDSTFIYVDKVNPADRPNITVEQVVDDLVSQGAELIITNSDDFKDGTREAATMHPDVTFLHISGDDVLAGTAPDNLGNLMGRMEYGKMIAGCAAALQSETGSIAYLGPLINDETRRLVNAAYLGATYCNENLRDEPFEQLTFSVVWIGFWFNIPGITLDPTQVADDFINSGSDVIISGIDTTEALVQAGKAAEAGKHVYAIPYDFQGACEQAPDVCLGVPYFNWGPAYVDVVTAVQHGTWEQSWEWLSPNWVDINDPDTSAVGFIKGDALSADNSEKIDTFIAGLADESISLFEGPLNYQDGSVYLADAHTATDEEIWYQTQLLEGIEGQSSAD